MNQRLLSCGVFIDLEEAFDTVDHETLPKVGLYLTLPLNIFSLLRFNSKPWQSIHF